MENLTVIDAKNTKNVNTKHMTTDVDPLKKELKSFLITYKNVIDYMRQLATVYSNRIKEYGSSADQLDYIYHHGLTGYQQRQSEIKTKYPKPNMADFGITQSDIDSYNLALKPEGFRDPLKEV